MNPVRMSAADFAKMNQNPGNQDVGKKKPTNAIRMPVVPKQSKSEIEYGRILNTEFPATNGYSIMFEPFSFRLRNGTRYSPDWVVFHGTAIVRIIEVKGTWRLNSAGASAMKFKSCVTDFPMFRYRHASKSANGWSAWESSEPPR